MALFACASKPPSEHARAAPTERSGSEDSEPSNEPPAVEAQAETPTAGAGAADDATEASAEAPVATPDPSAICERLCQRVESGCKAQAVEACRASCKEYVVAWERCPVEVEEALTCQTEAKDAMLCANVAAPSCVSSFSELGSCRAGRTPPRPRPTKTATADGAESESTPAGWKRIEDAELSVSLVLPVGANAESGARGKRLVALEGAIEYLVESPQRFSGEATDKALLRAVLDYVGTACHKPLKVHGRFEKDSVVHVHFDTSCKDGTQWRGMLHVSPERLVVTSARSEDDLHAAEHSTKLEALFYGLRFTGR